MSESLHVRNKRILILANFDLGLYRFRKALIEELLSRDNEVYISLPQGDLICELEKLGCRFIETDLERRGMNPVRDLKLYRNYRKIIKKIRPDLVIAYTIKPNIYGGLACRVSKTPFVSNITGLGSAIEGGGVLSRLVFFMYKSGLKKAKKVFFENEGNRDIMVNAGVVPFGKTCVLNGAGIDTREYPAIPYPKEKTIRFLFVGRIMKEKGVDELFEAATKLKNEFTSDVLLDVVGLFEESYEQKINELISNGIIEFHGYQTDIKKFYKAAHCVVLPSYHEGMSNVLLEGASSARPLITSDIHGCKEAVIDGESGFLCEAKNADSLYDAMKRFCTLSQAHAESMGLKARRLMCEKFDKKEIIKLTMDGLSDGLQ